VFMQAHGTMAPRSDEPVFMQAHGTMATRSDEPVFMQAHGTMATSLCRGYERGTSGYGGEIYGKNNYEYAYMVYKSIKKQQLRQQQQHLSLHPERGAKQHAQARGCWGGV